MDNYPATQMLDQLLDATQLLGDDGAGAVPAVVSRLEVGMAKYQIVVGDNKIGRDSLSVRSLSATPALVGPRQCSVHDVRSSNGTKKGWVRLRPNVRYNLESGEQLVFRDVTAVFIAGVEVEAAADSDNDSNVSDSLFDIEDNNDGEDENIPPNFVPDTPVVIKPPVKPFSRPLLGDLSFVPVLPPAHLYPEAAGPVMISWTSQLGQKTVPGRVLETVTVCRAPMLTFGMCAKLVRQGLNTNMCHREGKD